MNDKKKPTPAERARFLRHKKPALASMGFDTMLTEIDEISGKCADVHYWTDTDNETLLNALDGDEDDAWEFKMAFSDLESSCERLRDEIYGSSCIEAETFDTCTVALVGNRYDLVGFDSYEEDYFSLGSYDSKLAETEAGKRLMRMTKSEMISTIGQCFGILMAYLDVRQRFDYLSATFDILRDQNTSLLDTIKEIERLYDMQQGTSRYEECKEFEDLLKALPEEIWLM